MASRNVMIGTGAALAGIGGIAAAAVTSGVQQEQPQKPVAQPVVTRTVVVRTVEHRVRRLKPKHHKLVHPAIAAAPAPAPVAAAAPVRVVAAPAAPAPARVVSAPQPIRTRASGGGSRSGDDAGEHQSGHENEGGESQDD